MGFLQDLFTNPGNLLHDIKADPIAEGVLGAGALLAAPFLLPEIGAGLGAAGSGLGSLFGAGATDVAGSALGGALGGATAGGEASLGALGAAGGAGGLAALGDTEIPSNALFTSGNIPGNLSDTFQTVTDESGVTTSFAPTTSPLATQAQLGGSVFPPTDPTMSFGATTGGSVADASILGGGDIGAAAGGDVAGGGGGGGFLSNLGTGALNQITKNPIGLGLGGAGLAYAMANKGQQSAYDKGMAQQAGILQTQGNQLMGYLQSGTLPPGLQESVNQQVSAAKAKAIQNAAAQGMSTDPTQNTALAADLTNIDRMATAQIAQIGQQLMEQGQQEVGLSAELMKTLSTFDKADQKAIGDAIANFAKAISPSNTIALNFGGQKQA